MALGRETVSTVTSTKWMRSWRLELFTDLGSDFRLVAHMENVTTTSDGQVIHEDAGTVTRSLSSVGSDPRVQGLQSVLIELLDEWRAQDEAAPKEVLP